MSREAAYGSKYKDDKLIDRILLGNIDLDSKYSISAATFTELKDRMFSQFDPENRNNTTYEIELPSGFHIPSNTPITGDRMTFLPMRIPFVHNKLENIDFKMDVYDRIYLVDALKNPELTATFMNDRMKNMKSEVVCILCLNEDLSVGKINIISAETLQQTLTNPRDLFKPAINRKSTGIILLHNHPFGDLYPSAAEKDLTKRLGYAGQNFNIPLIDHIIVSPKGSYSIGQNEPALLAPLQTQEPVTLMINQTCATRKTNSKGIEGWVLRFPEKSVIRLDGKLTNIHGWQMFVPQGEKNASGHALNIPWPQRNSETYNIYEPNGKRMIRHAASEKEIARCIETNPEFKKNQWTRFRIREQYVSVTKNRNGKDQYMVTCPPDTIIQTERGAVSISGYRFFPYSLQQDKKFDHVLSGSFRKDYMVPLYRPKTGEKGPSQKYYAKAGDLSTALYEQYIRFRDRERQLSNQEIQREQEQKNEARTGGMAQVGDIISDLINTYRNMEYETNTDIKKRMEEIIGDENNPYYKLKISMYRRAISAESESAKDNPFLSMIKEAGFEGEYEEFRNLTHQQIVNKVKQADVEID